MPWIILLTFALVSCSGFRPYKDVMGNNIGKNANSLYWLKHKNINQNTDWRLGYPAYVGTYQTHNKNYEEHAMKFIAPSSKTKGICTTIFKVRKSDNIIVSWRSEGKKSDCVWRNSYE